MKGTPDLSLDEQDALDLVRLDAAGGGRERISITKLLHQARDVVTPEASARSVTLVVVWVSDEVFVDRVQIVLIVAALLRDAIHSVAPGGRVVVTGQDMERELVVAVYDNGRPTPDRRCSTLATAASRELGARVWHVELSDGNLALFAIPLSDSN